MKPAWLKRPFSQTGILPMKADLRRLKLHSVCEEARCPNLPECFSKKVATVMIMGEICTRSCKFCAVTHGRPAALDPAEPTNVAHWVYESQLRHVVITSVDFFQTVREVKKTNPQTTVEVLTPDFQGRGGLIGRVCSAGPAIYNHNLETVERLTPHVRSASKYRRSLGVIAWVKKNHPNQITKSGLMLGLGETKGEVIQTMREMIESGCDLLTLGQYLRPTPEHLPVAEYIHPSRFDEYRETGLSLGFKGVFSGPFVRSSYLADEFLHNTQLFPAAVF